MSNNVGFFGTKVGAWCNKQTAPTNQSCILWNHDIQAMCVLRLKISNGQTTMRHGDIEDRLTKLEALVDLLIRQTKTTTVESKETFSALDFTGKQHAVIQMIYCGYSTKQMAKRSMFQRVQ